MNHNSRPILRRSLAMSRKFDRHNRMPRAISISVALSLISFAATKSGVCRELTPKIASVSAPRQLLEPHAVRPLTEETLIKAKEELRLRQENLQKHHLTPPL